MTDYYCPYHQQVHQFEEIEQNILEGMYFKIGEREIKCGQRYSKGLLLKLSVLQAQIKLLETKNERSI